MSGHGHVVPNADGTLTRCGGPRLCKTCQAELAELQSRARLAPRPVRDALRICCYEIHNAPSNFREQQAVVVMLNAMGELERQAERIRELEAQLADARRRPEGEL